MVSCLEPLQEPTEGNRNEPTCDSRQSMCRTGLARRLRASTGSWLVAESRVRWGWGGELETANKCGQIHLLRPHPPTPICPAPTDLFPRNDRGATSGAASLTSHCSPLSVSFGAFPDPPCTGGLPVQHRPLMSAMPGQPTNQP